MGFDPELTDDLDEPYSQRSTALLPSYTSPSVIGVAGKPYLLDTTSNEYTRQSVEVLQQRNTSNVRDLLLLPQGIWRQSVQSWHQGAGQSNMDRDNALPYRYKASYGIDPWTLWEISLLPETQPLEGTDAMTGPIWLTTYGDYLAVVNDDTISWYDSLTDLAPYGTTTPTGASTVIDVAPSAPSVTLLYSNGDVWTTAGPAGTPALNGTYAGANFIGYDKDYLITGVGNVLKDITGGTPGVTVFTHPTPAFRWVGSCAGNSCIYVLGGVADKYVIHRVGIKDDGTGLSPAIVAATLPDGEIGYSIGSYLGFVFVGTNKGVRMAAANAAGDLTLGALLPTDGPVNCFEGQDRFVWYGNPAINGAYPTIGTPDLTTVFPVSTVPGLSRMDLTSFTVTELTPAYAPDLVAVGATATNTRSVVTYSGKRVFSIDSAGVWYEGDSLMPGGWLEQGVLSFSVEDDKTALYSQTKWEPLVGSVYLDLSFNSLGYSRFAEYVTQGSIKSENTQLNGVTFSRAEARFILLPGAEAAAGPRLTRWELRARPSRGRASRWVLPIVNHEVIQIDGVTENRDPDAEALRLIELVESGTMFVYQESRRAYQVVAVDYKWIPQRITQSGKTWEGVFVLTIEEVV